MSRAKDLKSQAELARQVRMDYRHLNDCLKGRRNASLDKALDLADLTKTDPRQWGKNGSVEGRLAGFLNWQEAQPR